MKDKKTYNLIMTCLSTIGYDSVKELAKTGQATEFEYHEENGDIKFKGVMTNEAGVKYVMKKLEKNDDCLDSIYYVASNLVTRKASVKDKVTGEIYEYSQTHEEFFKDQIAYFSIEENMDTPELYRFPKTVSNNPGGDELVNLSAEILQDILKIKKQHSDKEFHLYIEANGGFRDFVNIIVALIRTLSTENIFIDEVIGTNMAGNQGTIVNKTGAYQIYDFYSGIDEFINYGRSKKLKEYFNNAQIVQTRSMKKVVESINHMSDAFILCRPKKMLDTTKQLKNAIDAYNQNQTNDSDDRRVFSYLTSKIENEYSEIFESFNTDRIYDYSTLKAMISYCLNHNLIQQALTIYSECMPNAIYDLNIIYPSPKTKEYFDDYFSELPYYQKDYSFEYVFIQQYMLLDDGYNKKTGLYKRYIEENHKEREKESKFKKLKNLLTTHYAGSSDSYVESQFDTNTALEVMKHYWAIKDARNISNHADSTDKEIANFRDINLTKKYIEESIQYIDKLTNK